MNTTRIGILLGWAALAAAAATPTPAPAQIQADAVSPTAAAPTPPWVAPVPANARWRIAVSPLSPPKGEAAEAEAGATLKELRVAKTGAVKHDFLVYTDWNVDEFWYRDKVVFQHESFDKKKFFMADFAPSDASAPALGDPVHSLGFTGFGWIGPKTYDGVVTYRETPCHHYRAEGEPAAEAWVRVADRMPVAYQMDGFLYVYSFVAPPSETLDLPMSCQALWSAAELRKKQQAMFARDLGKH